MRWFRPWRRQATPSTPTRAWSRRPQLTPVVAVRPPILAPLLTEPDVAATHSLLSTADDSYPMAGSEPPVGVVTGLVTIRELTELEAPPATLTLRRLFRSRRLPEAADNSAAGDGVTNARVIGGMAGRVPEGTTAPGGAAGGEAVARAMGYGPAVLPATGDGVADARAGGSNASAIDGTTTTSPDAATTQSAATTESGATPTRTRPTTPHPGAASTHPGAASTHPGAASTHPGAASTHPGAAAARSGAGATRFDAVGGGHAGGRSMGDGLLGPRGEGDGGAGDSRGIGGGVGAESGTGGGWAGGTGRSGVEEFEAVVVVVGDAVC